MKNFLIKNYFIIILIIVAALIIYMYWQSKKNIIHAWNNSKYTIATMTSNWHQKNNKGVGMDFQYIVNGEKFSKTCRCDLKKGSRYIVLYDSLQLSNYLVLEQHPVPDSIETPSNGWKFNEIPIPIDSADLKMYFDKLGINE